MRILTSLFLLGAVLPAAAQQSGAGRPGPRPLLPRDREMALARSAAPASVTAGARGYIFTDTRHLVAGRGTNAERSLGYPKMPAKLPPPWLSPHADPTPTATEKPRNMLH